MLTTRRQFLEAALGAGSLWALSPVFSPLGSSPIWACGSGEPVNDRVLVVLQLSGGNDGLNTVVPYADDVYGRSRTTLRLTDRDVHRMDDYLGFHPELKDAKELFSEGLLSVVQGVGYAHNNRDHEAAMLEWQTARPGDRDAQTGWIGRTVDLLRGSDPACVPATFVGPIVAPFVLNAERSVVPAVESASQWARTSPWTASGQLPAPLATPPESAEPLLELVRNSVAQADRLSRQVESVLTSTDGSDRDYPSFDLARQLHDVSRLIQADLGIRMYCVELGGGGDGIGGFDNHANQRDNHASLLRELSASVAAFVRDLQRRQLLSRVLLMTYSEFGRTLRENGRRGTDHGAAAPVLLAGGGLRGGLYGDHPSLTELDGDSPRFLIDYRCVLRTLLHEWLGLDAKAVLGGDYESIGVLA